VHRGDFFVPLDRYRRLMAAQGLPPQRRRSVLRRSGAPGAERDFSLDYVRATLPKVQELASSGLLDDGWQVRTGDWTPDRQVPARRMT
jgi:alpha-galactosidase